MRLQVERTTVSCAASADEGRARAPRRSRGRRRRARAARAGRGGARHLRARASCREVGQGKDDRDEHRTGDERPGEPTPLQARLASEHERKAVERPRSAIVTVIAASRPSTSSQARPTRMPPERRSEPGENGARGEALEPLERREPEAQEARCRGGSAPGPRRGRGTPWRPPRGSSRTQRASAPRARRAPSRRRPTRRRPSRRRPTPARGARRRRASRRGRRGGTAACSPR